MQFRKLFSPDNERALRPRQRLGAEYIEGRGLYPEPRSSITERPLDNEIPYDDHLRHRRAPQSDYSGRWDSSRGVTKRRMPLTTLEALVQIRANRLAHESA